MMKYVMGLDIGTSGCKANVFDEKGTLCTGAYREYIDRQHDGMIDPEVIWDNITQVIRECTAQYPMIEAVSATSFGESFVALDLDGKVLGESVLYTSVNAEKEWKELDGKPGMEKIAEITGLVSHPMYTVSRVIWMKKYEPEKYARTDKLLFFSCFALHRLGARAVAENTHAARSMMFDIRKNEWSSEIIQAAGIDQEKLPPIVFAGDPIGQVSADMAQKLGFENHPQIIAGGQDQPCVTLGMGAVHPGDVAYGMGSVECFTLVMGGFHQSQDMQKANLICSPHIIPGCYVTYGLLFSGGIVISDLRARLYAKEWEKAKAEGKNVYNQMMGEMPETSPDLYYLPHLTGTGTPQMDPFDKGLIYGLTTQTGRGEIVRAALEGISFDIRENVENMKKCGLPVKKIRASGGGSRNPKAVQVRSTALGYPISVVQDDQAGIRGLYYIIAKTLGWIGSWEKDVPVPFCREFFPEKDDGQMERKYQIFRKLYQVTRGISQ